MNRPGVNCPGVNCPGVNCPGVNCPDTGNCRGIFCVCVEYFLLEWIDGEGLLGTSSRRGVSLGVLLLLQKSCRGGIKGGYGGAAARNTVTTKRDIEECVPSCIFNL